MMNSCQGRTHLDIFIGVNVLLHLLLLGLFWEITPIGFNITWSFLCILIGIYGFLCTKPAIPV